MYIQKKKYCDRQQYQFLGHLHFGQRTNKVVHFRKLEHEETIKTEKKAWRLSFGAKAATQEVGCWWWDDDELPGTQATPGPLGFSAARQCWWFRWCWRTRPSAVPPSSASDRSSLSPDNEGGICWGGGRGRPPWRRRHPSAGCAAWLLLSFHNFGYKVIQLKEVTEDKAMREEGVYSAWWEGLHDSDFSCSMAVEGKRGKEMWDSHWNTG